MITKERLEQLIEKGATIFYFDPYEDDDWGIVEVDTKNFKFSHNENCYTNFCKKTYRTNPQPYKMFEDVLFETKEDAEEYAEFGNITRTERLELPSWEDVQREEDSILVELKTQGLDCLFIDKKNNYVSVECREEFYFRKPLTRENYNEARRLCVKLFKGETDKKEVNK